MYRHKQALTAWILCMALIAAIGWTGFAAAAEYASPELLISTKALAGLKDKADVKILDARKPEAYKAGHIPGALPMPRRSIQYTERGVKELIPPLKEMEAALGKLGIKPTDTLILYDETITREVARVFWTMDVLGHAKIRVLNGGMSKWAKERRPISRETPSVTTATYKARPDWSKWTDAAYVLANLKNPKVAILDSRSARVWKGVVASKAVKRAGRIPGSVNVDSDLTLASKGGAKLFKSADELAKLYEKAGLSKDKEIIIYCRTGVRATANYLALKLLGYDNLRSYDASMVDWGNRAELPMERSKMN